DGERRPAPRDGRKPAHPFPARRPGLGAPLTPDDTTGSWPRARPSPSPAGPTTPEPQALNAQRIPTGSAASSQEPEPKRAPQPAVALNSEVTIAPLLGQDRVADDQGDPALADEPPPEPARHATLAAGAAQRVAPLLGSPGTVQRGATQIDLVDSDEASDSFSVAGVPRLPGGTVAAAPDLSPPT